MKTLKLLAIESIKKKHPKEVKKLSTLRSKADAEAGQNAVLGMTWGRRLVDLTCAEINQSTLILKLIIS